MTNRVSAAFLIVLTCTITSYGALADDDVQAGQVLFTNRCIACHSAHATHKPAPLLDGVYGRRAGTVLDYPYSTALKAASISWDARTLDKWLTDPPAFIPGVNMQARVDDPRDRQNIIAYLKSISGTSAALVNAAD